LLAKRGREFLTFASNSCLLFSRALWLCLSTAFHPAFPVAFSVFSGKTASADGKNINTNYVNLYIMITETQMITSGGIGRGYHDLCIQLSVRLFGLAIFPVAQLRWIKWREVSLLGVKSVWNAYFLGGWKSFLNSRYAFVEVNKITIYSKFFKC